MARKSRIAEVYLQVKPSMDGFFGEMDRKIAKELPAVGAKTGTKLGTAIQKGVNAVKIGSVVGTALVAGIGTAIAGKTLSSGLSRALNIEDAQASLKGLGYEAAQVQGITNNVLDAVRGTAYGLDEAMTVAASALAAGVPEGETLTNYLKAVSDTEVITKSSLGDIGLIFNSITGMGKAYTQDLKQLAMRGLPIFTWLAKEMGVTQGEIQEMVSKGEVSAAIFRKAIVDNIGGAALSGAETVRGSIANVNAAIARLGAGVVSGGLPVFKNILGQLIPFIDALTEKLKPISEQFWEAFGPRVIASVERVLAYIIDLVNGARLLPKPIRTIIDVVGKVARSFREWVGSLDIMGTILPNVVKFAQMVGGAIWSIVSNLKPAVPAIIAAATAIGVALLPVLKAFVGVIVANADNIGTILSNIASIVAQVVTSLAPYFGTLLSVVTGVLSVIHALLPALTGLSTLLKDNAEGVAALVLGFAFIKGGLLGLNAYTAAAKTLTDVKKGLTKMTEVLSVAKLKEWFQTEKQTLATARLEAAQKRQAATEKISASATAFGTKMKAAATATSNGLSAAWAWLDKSAKKAAASTLMLAKTVGTAIVTAMKNAAIATWGAIKAFTVFIARMLWNLAVLAANVTALAIYGAGWLIVKGALLVAAAAQWILNAAVAAFPIIAIIAAIAAVVGGILWLANETTFFQDTWKNLVKFFQDSIANIGKWFGDVGRSIGNFFVSVGRTIGDVFKGIGNFFVSLINGMIRGINVVIGLLNGISIPVPEWAQAALGGAKKIGFNIPKVSELPHLAKGANIMGPTVAVVGEKKPETVTDLGLTNRHIALTNKLAERALTGDSQEKIVVNLTVNAGDIKDPQELARLIQREQRKALRRV